MFHVCDVVADRCVAENAAGRVETRCNLTIKPPTKPPGGEDLIQPEVVERAHAPPPRPAEVTAHQTHAFERQIRLLGMGRILREEF